MTPPPIIHISADNFGEFHKRIDAKLKEGYKPIHAASMVFCVETNPSTNTTMMEGRYSVFMQYDAGIAKQIRLNDLEEAAEGQ